MFKWGASGSVNREPLSQSTDNYSPRLMSMDSPQHSGELTNSCTDTRNCKRQRFHEQCFPAEVPEKTKVRSRERAPPLPVPRTTLQIHDFSCLSWNYQRAWKMLLWKSTVTKDLIPKATKVLPNNKTDHSSVREQLSSLYSRGRSTNDPAYHWKKECTQCRTASAWTVLTFKEPGPLTPG